jgi:opacity protein-like surface antigen
MKRFLGILVASMFLASAAYAADAVKVVIWAFVVMPICNESGWKPPCLPKGFVS